jgi:biotin transport system substrate-specific component
VAVTSFEVIMTSTTVATRDRVRSIFVEAGLVVSLAGLTALAAKIAIQLPWTPVPVTLQVAAVIFAGAAFGSRRGALSQMLYLAAGLCGLPVFAPFTVSGPAVVLAPTFGYLLSFPLAAWLAGRWAGPKRSWISAATALGSIYSLGLLWLLMWTRVAGESWSATWVLMAGFLPFLPLDALKTALAVLSAQPVRRRVSD